VATAARSTLLATAALRLTALLATALSALLVAAVPLTTALLSASLLSATSLAALRPLRQELSGFVAGSLLCLLVLLLAELLGVALVLGALIHTATLLAGEAFLLAGGLLAGGDVSLLLAALSTTALTSLLAALLSVLLAPAALLTALVALLIAPLLVTTLLLVLLAALMAGELAVLVALLALRRVATAARSTLLATALFSLILIPVVSGHRLGSIDGFGSDPSGTRAWRGHLQIVPSNCPSIACTRCQGARTPGQDRRFPVSITTTGESPVQASIRRRRCIER